jgi:hypothetical protein
MTRAGGLAAIFMRGAWFVYPGMWGIGVRHTNSWSWVIPLTRRDEGM